MIETTQEGRVVTATFSNPPHELMNRHTVAELGELVERATEDEGIGAVILTGAGGERFVAHYDVAEILAGSEEAPEVPAGAIRATLGAVRGLRRVPGAKERIGKTQLVGAEELLFFHDVLSGIGRSGAVFIAAINGSAMGGGCELSLACDIRLMSKGDHMIGQPEILLGFPPGGGGTQRLARLLGAAKALELCLTGAPLTPAQAEKIGLVNETVAKTKLLGRAQELAAQLASRPKPAVAATKRAIIEGGSLPLPGGLAIENAAFMHAATTPEAKELMRLYVDRIEQSGELPLYDERFRRAAIEGDLDSLES